MTEEWADHESLLGMLQRGRGRGLQEVSKHPDGAQVVVQCIQDDCRWDDFEERGWYFARLMTRLRIPLDSVAYDLSDGSFLGSVWCETLLALAADGSADAARVLHAYIRESAPDDRVGEAVDVVWDDGGEMGREGLRELALERLGEGLLLSWAHPREGGPWLAWSDVPAIAAALEAWSPSPRPLAPDLSGLGAMQLVEAAREWPHGRERRAAISELARRGDGVLLEIAEDVSLRNSYGTIPGLDRALAALGPKVLPRARLWVKVDDEFLRFLAGRLLANLGLATDGPALLNLFDAAVDEGDWLATEQLAVGLGRIGESTAVPLLTRAWDETLHSHARADYLRSLVALGADALPALYAEAVDDCESEVRGLVP